MAVFAVPLRVGPWPWKMLDILPQLQLEQLGFGNPPYRGTGDVWLPLLGPVLSICRGVTALPFIAGTQHPCPALPVRDATPRAVPAPLGRDCPVPGSLQRLRNLLVPREQHPRGCHRARAGWCPPAHPHGAGLGRAEGSDPPHSRGLAFQGCPWLLTSLHTPKSWQASAPRC